MLNSQLAALKKCFADHQNEIKCLMSQVAEVNDEKEYKSRKQGESPNISTKNIRYSPKNITKGLFFKVTRTDHKKINFSPSITRT